MINNDYLNRRLDGDSLVNLSSLEGIAQESPTSNKVGELQTTSKFMGNNDHISQSNLEYFIEILNELYTENQSLKNGDDYHKLVLSKLDQEIEFYHQVLDTAASEKKKIYFEIINCLEEVKEELQGEDYC